jgi:hypothetical protein
MILNPVCLAFASGLVIGGLVAASFMALLQITKSSHHPNPSMMEFDTDVTGFLFDTHMEILRARTIHPGNKHLLAALTEEVGELNKAYLEGKSDERKRTEAMHVACVAARIATEKDGDFQ